MGLKDAKRTDSRAKEALGEVERMKKEARLQAKLKINEWMDKVTERIT